KGALDQPSDSESGGDSDRNKCGQIVGVLVLRNFVAEAVRQVGDHDSKEKPESRTVSLERVNHTRESQNERQRKPGKAEFAHRHSAEFSKLFSDYLRLKGEIDLILATCQMPPYFLQRTGMAPVNNGRPRSCEWQVRVDGDESANRNQCSANQPSA